jgi:hypothetical protein
MIRMILLIALCVFAAIVYSFSPSHDRAPCSTLADWIMDQHIKEMKKKGYYLTMRGWGMPDGSIHSLDIGFDSKKTPSIDEARALYVPAIEHFLALINQDMVIRPYLHRYPFTPDDLTYFMDFPRIPVDTSGVWPIVFVFYCKGEVDYCRLLCV